MVEMFEFSCCHDVSFCVAHPPERFVNSGLYVKTILRWWQQELFGGSNTVTIQCGFRKCCVVMIL